MKDGKPCENKIIDPEKEYYKKKLDELSGRILRSSYELSEQSNNVHLLKKGYQVISNLQKIIETTQNISNIYKEVVSDLYFYLQMDRTAIFLPSVIKKEFTPIYIKGFPDDCAKSIKEKKIRIPDKIINEQKSVIVNSQTLGDNFISLFKKDFITPYFILTPVIVNKEIISFIFGGRMNEVKYIGYSPFDKTYADTFESIAGFIGAWIKEFKRQEMVDNERLRISKDMHDEIGANLTHIALLSNIVFSQPDKENNKTTLNQISHFANETIEKLDEIVWAVNPSNDNLKNLIAYISEYAEYFFSRSEINCRFDFPVIIPEIRLSPEIRHHFFLIVKEALNNVQKYSFAASVTLSLKIQGTGKKRFKFIIKDEGKGFDSNFILHSSNGIKNMKERMISIGGNFGLKSIIGKGTEITLDFQLD
jgi:two-component sensor histidine kinase